MSTQIATTQTMTAPVQVDEAARLRRIFRTGARLMDAGKLEDALTVFDYLAIMEPGLPEHWVAGGMARMRLGLVEDACASFQVAEAGDESDPVPVMLRGLCRLRQGRCTEALAALRRADSLALASGADAGIRASIRRHLDALEDAPGAA